MPYPQTLYQLNSCQSPLFPNPSVHLCYPYQTLSFVLIGLYPCQFLLQSSVE